MINPASASLLIPYLKDVWTMSWIGSGLVTIFVPVIIWQSQRGAYFSTYGAYQKAQDYYEQKQRYYEQQNNGNNNNGNNNQNSYYRECSWINWPCRSRQWKLAIYNNGDNGGGDRVRQPVPAWYVFLGGETEAMQRWREENTGEDRGGAGGANGYGSRSNAGMNFAYFITLVLFLSLLAFGAKTVAKREPLTQLTFALVVAAMVAVMNLIMSVSAIPSDDRDLEGSYYGWYGQTSVLMVYTNFWITLFSFAFLVVFQIKNFISRNKYAKEQVNDDDDTQEKGGDYHAPSEVQMA